MFTETKFWRLPPPLVSSAAQLSPLCYPTLCRNFPFFDTLLPSSFIDLVQTKKFLSLPRKIGVPKLLLFSSSPDEWRVSVFCFLLEFHTSIFCPIKWSSARDQLSSLPEGDYPICSVFDHLFLLTPPPLVPLFFQSSGGV